MAFFTGKSKGKGPKSGCLGIVKETDVFFTVEPCSASASPSKLAIPPAAAYAQYRVEAGTDFIDL